MAISSYPNGFAEGVLIRGVPLLQSYPGRVFWVGNNATPLPGEAGAADTNKGSFLSPFSTIAGALLQCAAGRGDVIVVRPGHVTTITAAAGLILSVTNVALVGLGAGAFRPTINFTTAVGASMTITAAGVSMTNFLFTGGIDALTGPLGVQAADVAILNCEYRDVTGQATDVILTTAAANRFLLDTWRHDGDSAAGTNAGIAIVGGDGIILRNLSMDGNFAVACVDIRTTLSTDIRVGGTFQMSLFRNRGTGLVLSDTITGSTGHCGPNLYADIANSGTGNILASMTMATCQWFDPIFIVNRDSANLRGLQLAKGVASDA